MISIFKSYSDLLTHAGVSHTCQMPDLCQVSGKLDQQGGEYLGKYPLWYSLLHASDKGGHIQLWECRCFWKWETLEYTREKWN